MVMCKVGELPNSKQQHNHHPEKKHSSSKNNSSMYSSQQQRQQPPSSTSMTGFPASANNGGHGFSPITSSRRPSVLQDDGNASQGAGKSCLVLPHLGGKKKKRALRLSSSAASTADQSSTADPFQLYDNDQQSLLNKNNKHNDSDNRTSSNSRVDWYMETMHEGEEDDVEVEEHNKVSYAPLSSNGIPSEKSLSHHSRNNSTPRPVSVTPSSNSSIEPAQALLQFPTPHDRSHEARHRQSRTMGHMHAYQGELEPEGVRGQEATVLTAATTGTGTSAALQSNPLPLRNFEGETIAQRVSSRRQQLHADIPYEAEQNESIPAATVTPRNHSVSVNNESSDPKPRRSFESETSTTSIRKRVSSRRLQLQHQLEQEEFVSEQQQVSPSPLSSMHLSEQHEQPQQERHTQHVSVPNGDFQKSNPRQSYESTNSTDYKQIISNNVAEIAEQQSDKKDEKQSVNYNAYQRPEKHPSQSKEILSSVHREEEQGHGLGPHAHNAKTNPTGEDHSNHTASLEESRSFTGHIAEASTSSSPKSFRQSAPVDVDDSSFQDPMGHIQGIHAMAMEHVMRGEYDMALQAFTQVLRVYLTQYGRAHPLTASAYHNLGTVHTKRAGLLLDHTLHQRHCREQALLCFQAAARSARDCPQLGPNHPNVAVSLVRIGFLLLQSRQYQNAVITFEESLRIRLDHYGPTHGLVANLYNNLGVCHMHLQSFSVGRRYLQQALDIQKELLNQEDYSTTALLELADTLCNIGGLNLEWIRQQGPDARHALDAESAFLEALELRSRVLGEEHPLTNQVRSLHDMVRSIPLPKGLGTTRPSEASFHGYPEEFTPGDVSEMSFRTTSSKSLNSPHSRRSIQRQSDTEFSPKTPNTTKREILNLPSLGNGTKAPVSSERSVGLQHRTVVPTEVSQSKPGSPKDHGSTDTTKTDPNKQDGMQKVDDYDATEESCLLKRSNEDDQSQLSSLLVTYAQSTSSGNDITERKDTERMAAMRQAKLILDAHRDFLETPDPSGKKQSNDHSFAADDKQQDVNEDGLIPLAGDWPEPTYERISPEVLQNPARHLHTIHNCAANYVKRGRYMEAVHLFEMVVECQKSSKGAVHEDVGSALQNVGVAYLRMEEYYKALQAFEEAVRVRKGALGKDHPQVAVSLVKVGISLLLLRRLEDSLWIFREALSVRKLALGALHPSNARIYNNIGCVHVEFNELQEARRAFEAALDIQRNTLVNDPENGPIIFGASTTLQNLGYLYAKRDMHEKAAMVLRESLSLQEKVMDPQHPTVLSTLESLGEACLDARRFSHALKYYSELFERSQASPSMSNFKLATVLHKIAVIHEHREDLKDQRKKLELALRYLRSDTTDGTIEERKVLDKKIQEELRMVLEELEKKEENWV